MSDMPERLNLTWETSNNEIIYVPFVDGSKYTTEYIRADVVQTQLDAANKRIAERVQDLSDTTKQIEYERIQHVAELAERDVRIAELEAWQETAQRMEAANELQRQVIATQKQRIAELEAALRLATKWLDESCDAHSEYATDEGVAAMRQITKALPPPPVTP